MKIRAETLKRQTKNGTYLVRLTKKKTGMSQMRSEMKEKLQQIPKKFNDS